MTSRRVRFMFLALLLCFGLRMPLLFAQGTDLGTIRGTVTDSSGASVSNAQVDLTDLATGSMRHYTTNSHGDFEALALQSGHYTATIAAEGFGRTTVKVITLAGSATANADVVLHASAVTTIEVSSQGSTINTEDATISESLSPKAIIELPRDSRDVYQFLYLNPNITQSSEPGSFKFIGGQSYGASFSVDGQRSNGGVFGAQTQSQPSLESVGEVNVLDNTFSAEYAGIANIRVNTKRGGDAYHGSILYDNVNSAFKARSQASKIAQATYAPTAFFPNYPLPHSNSTDVAGSIGGPLPKLKKTWFFMAYEQNMNVSPIISSGGSQSVPHPSELAGDFSLLSNSAKPNVPNNIALTPAEIATDTVGGLGKQFITIPQRLLNPATTKIINLYFPKIGAGAPINANTGRVPGYSASMPSRGGQQLGDARIDHDFNDNNRMSGVYHGSAQQTAASPVAAPYTGLGLLQTDRLNSTVSLSYIHVFRSYIINEARGGYNLQHLYTRANTTLSGFLSTAGFTAADIAAYGAVVGPSQLNTYGNPIINLGTSSSTRFTSFAGGGRSGDRNLNQNLMTFGDTFTLTRGRHTLKVGADFVRNQAVDGFAATRKAPQGTFNYVGNGYGGSKGGVGALAAFLLGEPPSTFGYAFNPRPAMDVHNWENGFFAQDDFHVNSRLMLNIGMRYELLNPYIEKNGIAANFDPNYRNASTGQKGRYIVPSANAIPYLAPGLIAVGVVTAAQSGLGVGPSLVKPDRSDFGPRFGAAYRLTNKSVVRGGFGIYYPTSSAHIYRDSMMTNEFNQGITTLTNSITQGWPTGQETTGVSPNQGGTANGALGTPSANFVPVNLKNPRLYEWNVSFEYEFPKQTSIRVSYIGSHQTGQIIGTDLDQNPPSDNPMGTTVADSTGFGDGKTPCQPENFNCALSPADNARFNFPLLGTFVTSFSNEGHSMTNALQAQIEHRAGSFTFEMAYTLTSQNSSAADVGQDSLGGTPYDPFHPESDYVRDNWVSRNRFVAHGIYDLPFGRGKRFDSSASRLTDALIGGWQTSFNMFAKSGVAFTPYWACGDCDPVNPGNMGTPDEAADGITTSTYRPILLSSPTSGLAPGYQWNQSAYTVPTIGSDIFSHPGVVQRNSLTGPGAWGASLGVHKAFHVTDRVSLQLGADLDNVFNHPMYSPDETAGFASYAMLGTFNIQVDQTTPVAPGQQPKILPITSIAPNTAAGNQYALGGNFGQNWQSYSQEGISANRQIRLRGRITF